MRVLAVVLSCLLLATAIADARPSRRAARPHAQKQVKRATSKQVKRAAPKQVKRAAPDRSAGIRPRVAIAEPAPASEPRPIDPYAEPDLSGEDADDVTPARPRAPAPPPAPPRRPRGQSIGSPWAGRLQDATRLRIGDGVHIRRPHRAFGTRTTVEHVRRAIRATLASFPKAHALAIGDLSAEHGGWISEHSSHRSGRDVDLGFFFQRKPAGYPASFVRATDATLDHAATWALLVNLLDSHGEDGGVQVIFLDYDVQGLLHRWAASNGVKARTLDRIFQYPRGRYASGLVRHEPHHDDHFHVRFRCASADAACY